MASPAAASPAPTSRCRNYYASSLRGGRGVVRNYAACVCLGMIYCILYAGSAGLYEQGVDARTSIPRTSPVLSSKALSLLFLRRCGMRRVLFYRGEAPCCSTWGNAGTSYRITGCSRSANGALECVAVGVCTAANGAVPLASRRAFYGMATAADNLLGSRRLVACSSPPLPCCHCYHGRK
jgi:hypothetical protein